METIRLPIQPTGASLPEHIVALDQLAARLDTLPSRQAWPARVPFNSKASFDGSVINTGHVKVNIGGDEWVEMRPQEAAEYVRRRKMALLEDHARVTEGQQPRGTPMPTPRGKTMKTKEVRFSPVWRSKADNPAPAPTTVSAPNSARQLQATGQNGDGEGGFELRGPNGQRQDVPAGLQSLVDLVGEHLQDKLHLPSETETEDGLPIHEIRETPDGQLIGDEPIGADGEGEVTIPDEVDDYWTPEAQARREALKRRVFGDVSDTESDEDDSMDVEPSSNAISEPIPTPSSVPSLSPASDSTTLSPQAQTPFSGIVTQPLDRVTTPEPSTPHAQPSHRSPGNRPKGILKAPSRKKSVTFDSSVPLPPDSPPAGDVKSKLPFAQKPVPILNVPQPGKRTFGGLKSGFLQSQNAAANAASTHAPNLAPSPSATKPNFASRQVTESQPQPQVVEVGDDSMDVDDGDEEEKPKRKSLFAQRRSKPEFPSIDSVQPMPTMRNSIVERPPAAPQPGVPPPVGSVETPKEPTSARAPLVVVDNDSDADSYGDLGEFSDDEEDEYALDEALLRREAALALHRSLQRPREVDEDEVDPEAPDAQGNVYMAVPRVSTIQGGEGDEPLRIINPTADDLSQFMRVGRQDDGDLVFEPPTIHEDSDSDGEAEGKEAEDRRARRDRRRDVMDQLMSGVYDESPQRDPKKAERDYRESLPPSVQATSAAAGGVVERPPAPASGGVVERPPASGGVVERPSATGKAEKPAPPKASAGVVVERQPAPAQAPEPPQPPKKVSRFRAARQGA